MCLKLIVMRSIQMEAMAAFYTALGFELDYHSHGGSPMHYSFTTGKTVVEIYPLAKGQPDMDKYLRLGFEIEHFDEQLRTFAEKGIKIQSGPVQTAFGYMAVVIDPEGRKVELYKK